MSKQVTLSAAVSVMAMAAFALFGGVVAEVVPTTASVPMPIEAQAHAPVLPALGIFLPGLR